MMMMDCPTIEENPNLQPKEEQEKDNSSAAESSLYLHLLSDSMEGNFSVFYKIDFSFSDEPNFSQTLKLISKGFFKKPENLPHIGFGSAICDSILYLFGGRKDGTSFSRSNTAGYLDLASSNMFLPLEHTMKAETNKFVPLEHTMKAEFVPLEHTMKADRAFPITLTVGKKIYIFGSGSPGFGIFVGGNSKENWAEVFNTEDKLFKLISPPPPPLFKTHCVGVAALINKNNILLATYNFSDVFIYNVDTDQWTHKPREGEDAVSPLQLSSLRSPVIDNKYMFLYGNGKICAFDIDENQFLKNNISLLEYTLFDNEEAIFLPGVIHHLGGWKFSVVFADAHGFLVKFIYVVSFEIENPEHCGELNIKAGTSPNFVDFVLPGQTLVDSLLWSNQIVPSGNPNNGKRSLKRKLIVGGSSVTSHVDEDCMMNNNGETSRPELSRSSPEMIAELSKLQRKEEGLGKEISEMKLLMGKLTEEVNKWKVKFRVAHGLFDELGRSSLSDELGRSNSKLSNTNVGECVETGCPLENILSKVEAQLIEKNILRCQIRRARKALSYYRDFHGMDGLMDCKD